MREAALRELGLHLVEEELRAGMVRKNYREEVLYGIRLYVSWLDASEGISVRNAGKKELIQYYRYLYTRKTKPSESQPSRPLAQRTIHGYFQAVRKLYSVLYRVGAIAENPCHGLVLEKKEAPEMKRRPLGKEEMASLLDGIGVDNPYTLRDRTIYELIYSSGLRVSEAASLKVGDIDFTRREIIVHGKGRRDRLIPISIVARDLLERYLGRRKERKEEAVFMGCGTGRRSGVMSGRNVSRRFRKILKENGLDTRDVSTHSIRHSTATHLLENGASIRHVQDLLGHKNIEHTARYTEVLTENILKIFRQYHPREHELFEVLDDDYLERFKDVVIGHRYGKGTVSCEEQELDDVHKKALP